MNPYQVVKDFERALCEYTGAPHAVSTMSCTMALLLAVAWHLREKGNLPGVFSSVRHFDTEKKRWRPLIDIPKHTYVSVPMSIMHAGGQPVFRDEEWAGVYQLKPLPVWDCARRFTSGMYAPGQMQCVSFHWSKILGIQQGGAILTDDADAAAWLRRARFDGRTEGVAPKDDRFDFVGWHCYLSPEIAAEGLQRIGLIPRHNEDLPNDEYPDLSLLELFR